MSEFVTGPGPGSQQNITISRFTIRVVRGEPFGSGSFFSRIFRKDFGMFGRHDLNCVQKNTNRF